MTVPTLPPLTSRTSDPEDSNEASRQETIADLLSSLLFTFLYPRDHPNYGKSRESLGPGREPDEGTAGGR